MLETSALTAAELMTQDVRTVHPDTPLRTAIKMMLTGGFSGMPVVDEAGKAVGMLTEGDLIRWTEQQTPRARWWLDMLADGHELSGEFLAAIRDEHAKVRAAMTHPVVGVAETAPVREVARLLTEQGIKRVPVLRDDRPVGIITRRDLVRALLKEL
jgi:CBS domain-containing protein